MEKNNGFKNTKANNSVCTLAKKCGGCQLQNLSYADQLEYKFNQVKRLMGRFGKVSKVVGMEDPFHYRCKVQAAFGMTRSGKVISGVYQSSSHRIVCVDDCMIEDRDADAVIVAVRKLLPSFGILPYNEDTGKGILRHVLVRKSYSTGELMVVLVTATPVLPGRNNLVKALVKRFPKIVTVVQNVNSAATGMVLGERETVLYGSGRLEDSICGKRFLISPRSFYQINPAQTEKLYTAAVELAELTGNETVIDAYCGTGTIGIVAADRAKQVIGAELNVDAVKDARLNARRNGLDNISFVAADAGRFMRELAEEGEKIDLLFTDPPRAGCSREFLESTLVLAPERIVYISCNPETQARDAAVLVKGGYRVTAIQPFDMFPFTNHIENITVFERL